MRGFRPSIAWQNRYLLKVYALLRVYAPDHVKRDHIDDVIHEVIAATLEELRAGTWQHGWEVGEVFLRTLLYNRVRNRKRMRRRGQKRDGEYLRSREMTPSSWMSPDRTDHEEWNDEFRKDVLKSLPKRCRKAYRMVREEGLSYAEVARRLGKSVCTVRGHVVTAHRRYREELERQGITVGNADAEANATGDRHRLGAAPMVATVGTASLNAGRVGTTVSAGKRAVG